jgi:hypothetical protein
MKTVSISILSGALLVAAAVAQDNAAPSPSSPPSSPAPVQQAPPAQGAETQHTTRIAAGSVLPVSLTKTIDAKKAKAGDEVVAKVTQDMKSNSGEVLMAKDTKVTGHVTEAQARSKDQKESQLGILFDHAVAKNGSEMTMPMSIQAIVGQQNNNGLQNGQNGATNGTSPAAEPTSSASANSAGRSRMAGSTSSSSSYPSASASSGSNMPSDSQTSAGARPPITAQTEGVIGISDLKLAPSVPNSNQGSVMISDKNNVKIESGTLILLRVNQ